MIEFREPYITGAALARGTMFRVADCPLSPLQNRRGIVDMRLLSTDIAVHGDPIMWSPADTPERVAQQFIASLFGVPQLSVRLAELSEAHREVVAHWLAFWREHSALLLHSQLEVSGVERDYAVVEASENGVAVTVRYGDGPVSLPLDGCREWHVVNGGEAGVVVDRTRRVAGRSLRDPRRSRSCRRRRTAPSAASSGSTCLPEAVSPRAKAGTEQPAPRADRSGLPGRSRRVTDARRAGPAACTLFGHERFKRLEASSAALRRRARTTGSIAAQFASEAVCADIVRGHDASIEPIHYSVLLTTGT